jgi:GNAT superfamily N-acetyltransferase
MNSLIIRPATLDDCGGIRHIHRDCPDPWHDPEECAAWVERRLERGFYIQLAVLDGAVVGHGEWVVSDEPDGKFLYLGMLQIDADYQRRGIGRAMVADGEKYAAIHGCSHIVTLPDEGAEAFYESCGFAKGAEIMTANIPVADNALSQTYTPVDEVPFDVIKERRFVLGWSQACSRHMWELCNRPPSTDDRIVKSYRAENGDYVQLMYFNDNDYTSALLWSNTPTERYAADILALAACVGLSNVGFDFNNKYAYLFKDYDAMIDEAENIYVKFLHNM